MSTLEAIMEETKSMDEYDQEKVLFFVRNIKTKPRNPFVPLTESQVLADLEKSEREYQDGKYQDAETAIMQARKERGFI